MAEEAEAWATVAEEKITKLEALEAIEVKVEKARSKANREIKSLKAKVKAVEQKASKVRASTQADLL